MRRIILTLIIIAPTFLFSQNILSVFSGAETYNYKFKNWSDPYFQAGLINTNISNNWIREFRLGYQRIEGANGIIMGIMLGKQFQNKSLRIGSKITGFTDDAATNLHLILSGSINLTKDLQFSVEYSYLPVLKSNHALGAILWYKLWQE
jgi:hypothetical protein